MQFQYFILYDKYVTIPAKNLSASELEKLFKQAGFNGCIGSSDATHIGMWSCASYATMQHKGHMLNIISRSYNISIT